MTKKSQKKIRPVKAWAGISDGRLHCWSSTPRYYEIYPTRTLAKEHYEEFQTAQFALMGR